MSLDVVIATSKSDAIRTDPCLSISVEEHQLLTRIFSLGSYPVLSRISDFYSDAVFQGGDIDVLVNELYSLRTDLSTVGKLKDICSIAQEQSKDIYVICD